MAFRPTLHDNFRRNSTQTAYSVERYTTGGIAIIAFVEKPLIFDTDV